MGVIKLSNKNFEKLLHLHFHLISLWLPASFRSKHCFQENSLGVRKKYSSLFLLASSLWLQNMGLLCGLGSTITYLGVISLKWGSWIKQSLRACANFSSLVPISVILSFYSILFISLLLASLFRIEIFWHENIIAMFAIKSWMLPQGMWLCY